MFVGNPSNQSVIDVSGKAEERVNRFDHHVQCGTLSLAIKHPEASNPILAAQ